VSIYLTWQVDERIVHAITLFCLSVTGSLHPDVRAAPIFTQIFTELRNIVRDPWRASSTTDQRRKFNSLYL